MKKLLLLAAIVCLALPGTITAAAAESPYAAYLFTYFTGNRIDDEAVCYAVSTDGYNYRALNGGKPVLDSRLISSTGGVRDPHILRAESDSCFYMVVTDMVSANGWDSNRAMVLLKSYDLIDWTSSVVNIQKKYPNQGNLKRVWAPQTIFDPQAGKYMVYWSMKHGDGPDIIYYAYANPEFTDIEGEPKALFNPADGKSCIDGDIVYRDGTFYLFYKTEGHGNGIRVATTRSLTSGQWNENPEYKQQTTDAVEGAGTFKLIDSDKYILMYDVYTSGRYEFTETTDLDHFRVVDDQVSMDFHPRHGTIIPITRSELVRLTNKYGLPSDITIPAPKYSTDKPFAVGENTFLLNGKPFVVKAAEVHYPRIPRQYWEHRIEMCKALGMNTLCLYVFWNIHEPREGEFDFSGNNDIAEFCRLAQKHGMQVIVRPGPYVCAEWEMGGLPWWLLKKKDIRLREQDPYFMERVKIFEQEVGKQLAPLTIANGGPIIMVQVENEYGSYGVDKPYVSAIRDIVKEAGFDNVVLFQCDWASNFENNGLDDLTWTMNFGTGANIDNQFARLKELRPDAPLMCSEFWSGWFDKWGANHETRTADDMVAGIDEMLSKDISFSLYMTHGGTSFGHWAGANSPGFAPDVTSYDYDAPISEWGTATPKYHLLRQTMQKYSDKKLPAVPKANPIIAVPEFAFTEFAPLSAGIQRTVESRDIMTMEALDQGWGCIQYTTTLPLIPAGATLSINDPHDYAQIFIDGEYIGKVDRVKNEKTLALPATKAGSKLTILIEAMGRINFGRAIKDFKGITDGVVVNCNVNGHPAAIDLKNWSIDLIPDDYSVAVAALADATEPAGERGYYKGTFKLGKAGDTFLDMSTWGKGQVWVNGHALGRFWKIGPQQTLYVPGPWLKKGVNEVVVLDIAGPEKAVAAGLKQPKLDNLNLEKSNLHNNPGDRPDLNSATPDAHGQFAAGNGWQIVDFAVPAKGRLLAIEALSTQDGSDVAAIAELYVKGADGKRLSREAWTAKYADSENDAQGNHTADKVYDLQESTYWSTVPVVAGPHLIIIDLGADTQVSGIEYLPRAEAGAPGSIKEYKIYVLD